MSFDGKRLFRLETPETVRLNRHGMYMATFESHGYHTQTVPVVNSAGGGTIGSAVTNQYLGAAASGRTLLINSIEGVVSALPNKLELHFTPIEVPPPSNAFSYEVALERIRIQIHEMRAKRKLKRMQKPGRMPIGTSSVPVCKVFECEEVKLSPPKFVNPKIQRRQ